MSRFKSSLPLTILILTSLLFLTTSFKIALTRYQNFDYNKFDLGNMAQIVYNTANGRFMEVTDQFGTNMPRWGMSHVDPILVLFAPLFKVFPHPMLLVFFQHLLIVSAVFPLFWLAKKFIKSEVASLIVAATYLAYPAIGFILIWSEFHGLSLVAPLFIWATYLLEKYQYFKAVHTRPRHWLVFWLLFALMLIGKEEVGAMLAIWGGWLFFKNKKLGVAATLAGSIWFLACFYWIIPAYTPLRTQSVSTFLSQAGLAEEISPEKVTGQNFFLKRYSQLGDTYQEILLSPLKNPQAVLAVLTENQTNTLHTLTHLFGPFLFILALFPTILVALPDLLINLFSSETIFGVYNHRVSFIVAVLFVSYLYSLKLIAARGKKAPLVASVLAGVVFVLTLGSSITTANPLFLAGAAFVKNLVSSPAQAGISFNPGNYQIGDIREARAPVFKDDNCEEDVMALIDQYNPNIYTGPDYMGARTALREVNALFPTRLNDAELIVADVFDDKAMEPLVLDFERYPKKVLQDRLAQKDLEHLYSCGRMYVFRPDTKTHIYQLKNVRPEPNIVYASKIKGQIAILGSEIPGEILRGQKTDLTLYGYKAPQINQEFLAKAITFLTLEHEATHYVFKRVNIDSSFGKINLENILPSSYFEEAISLTLPERIPPGTYQVFYGLGTQHGAEEVMVGKIKVE